MNIPQVSIEITANTVAWYAAVVATLSALVSIYNAWKDRPRLKIKYETDQYMIGNTELYPDNKKYLCVNVINKGIRPIKIEQAHVQQYNIKGSLVLPDSFREHRSKVIDEKNPRTTFATSQDQFDLNMIYRIVVIDGVGNKYYKYTKSFPTIGRLYFLLKNLRKRLTHERG